MTLTQDTLFTLDTEPPPPPPKTPAKKPARQPLHQKPPRTADREAHCNPTCAHCRNPEGHGTCPTGCAVICTHTRGPHTATVCLTTVTVEATPAGPRLATVTCPWCQQLHWHPAVPGRRHRISRCGKPYIVHLAPAPERNTRHA